MSHSSREMQAADFVDPFGGLPTALAEVENLDFRGAALSGRVATPRGLRVLVVDDDRDTVDSVCLLGRVWGHEARACYDAGTVLAVAAVWQPHVVLLDIAMPAIDGFRLSRELRRQPWAKHTLLIAVTGYADEQHRVRGKEAGFDYYLVKPVDPAMVETLLWLEWRRIQDSCHAPVARPQKNRLRAAKNVRLPRDLLTATRSG